MDAPRTRTGKIRALQESAALVSFLQANEMCIRDRLGAIEISKSNIYGMWEIEQSSRTTLVKIIAGRMLIIGAVSYTHLFQKRQRKAAGI